jgi:predicted transposase/invertase (TIGR01784 family)
MKEKNNRKFYDEAFMEVFTNQKIVKSLLKDFIKEEWVDLIDFSTMESESSVFKGISDSKRESDLLLKFKLKRNPKKLYIFILLEFQSKVEPMILRLFEYLSRIYKKQKIELNTLYPVIPIVIYNGMNIWTDKIKFQEYFSLYSKDLLKYLPLFEYLLIDVVRFDDKLLRKLKGAASYFFLLDKTDLTQREIAENRIVGVLKKLIHSNPEIYNLLGRYITGLLQYKGLEISAINDYINDRGKSMLAQSMDKLIEEGRVEGMEQGELVEKHNVLIRLADRKFSISEENKQFILSVLDPDKLDSALDEIITANTIDGVIDKLK